jgi:transposase InsO family protein
MRVTVSKAWEVGHAPLPMPWDTKDETARRVEFIALLRLGGLSFAEVCRRFGISRKCGYKWRSRFAGGGEPALASRRPGRGRWPNQTPEAVEERVLALRGEHPTWGPRKLRRRLADLGLAGVPSASSIGRLLKRRGRVSEEASRAAAPCIRFERGSPNELWQMDYKGHFAAGPLRCHPFTAIDDHSRFLVALDACSDEREETVRACLTRAFAVHGLPDAILCDNGPPWSGSGRDLTALAVWLMRLGVRVIHGRPRHPQTQGKDERLHRTLLNDAIARADWSDFGLAQPRFDLFRRVYNHDRPHEALGLDTPAARYRPSCRPMPETLPEPSYGPGETTRPVKARGEITIHSRFFYIGVALAGLRVALRPTATPRAYRVCLGAITLGLVDCSGPADRPRGNYHPMLPYAPKL